jgi:EpsI family protein
MTITEAVAVTYRLGNISHKTWILMSVLIASAMLARVARPTLIESDVDPQLERNIPSQFGNWRQTVGPIAQVSINQNGEADINQPYDQSVLRGYVDSEGHQISLAVAWGRKQRQEVKIHRPELCYPAQGLPVVEIRDHDFGIKGRHSNAPIIGKRMIANDRNGGVELVSYWIRIGDSYSDSAVRTRIHILKEGLSGHVVDGVLVRVSQHLPRDSKRDIQQTFERQERFIKELIDKVPPETKKILAG